MNPATILKPVVLVTIGPTALGMGLARLYPGAAPRLAGLANRVGGVVLLLVALLLALPCENCRKSVACARPRVAIL